MVINKPPIKVMRKRTLVELLVIGEKSGKVTELLL